MAESEGRSSIKGCLKGCAIGCGVLIILGLALFIGGPLIMVRPFKQAMESREVLEQRYGSPDAYIPAPDGSIPSDRIERFLSVRRALVPVCDDLSASFAQMKSMERFDDQEEVSKGEVMREALKTVGSAFGIGPAMGGLFRARNRALVEAEMGLGEYTYLYVMAYHRQLQEENEFDEFLGEDPINSRIHRDLISMLQHQHTAGQQAAAAPEAIAALEQEIRALEDDRDRLPWQDGLPEPISASLAAYREQLDEVFCPAVTGLDLMINEGHGLSIEAR